MKVHIIPLAILIIYTLITLIVANFALRRRLGADHFLVAGRALPVPLVTAVILGDCLGGAATLGVAQRGYNEGIVGWIFTVSQCTALFVLAFTVAARYRKFRAVTIAEIVGRVFDARARLISAISVGMVYYVAGIVQVISGGALLAPLLGIDKWLADLIIAIVFIIVTVAGGLASIAIVNIMQCVVICLGTLLSVLYSLSFIAGSVPAGMARLYRELPATFWSFQAVNPFIWSGEILTVVFSFFAAQAVITGMFAAKDEEAAVRGTWISAAFILPIGAGYVIIGMCARIFYGPSLPGGLTAAPAMMLALNPIIAGIALCGLLAALISTGPICFLTPTQIIMRDLYRAYIVPDASDKAVLLLSRIFTIIFILSGWILGNTMYDILGATLWAFTLRLGIGVLLLTIIYMGTKWISEDGAFWGFICGFLALILWMLLDRPYGIHESFPTMVAVFIGGIVISGFRKRKTELSEEVKRALQAREWGKR